MSLTITVRLRHGRYEAGGERPSDAEWPPHPARVFCALAASGASDADWSALRWLETQAAPQVWADAEVSTGHARAYVVLNDISHDVGNLNWPGRSNGVRSRSFAVPTTASCAIVWPEAEPPADVLARIVVLARNVPYVGRSTSLAEVRVSAGVPEKAANWVVYEAARLGESGAVFQLRVPYQGYATALDAAYRDGRRAWEVARALPYAIGTAPLDIDVGEDAELAMARRGPFEDLMVWSITRPVVRIGGDQVVTLATALRRAVISRVPDSVPAQISGHDAQGLPHVGFLALPDVGHEHADGHILGLALAVPRNLDAVDLGQLVSAVVADPLAKLQLSPDRALALEYGADRYGIQPDRWTHRAGARTWVTATPLMLDGQLRRGRDEATEVARSLAIAGYPKPADVEVSAVPLLPGGVWRPRRGTIPSGRPLRQLVHARVTFEDLVIGPVLAGSLRYLGLGLFLPVELRRSRARGRAGAQGERSLAEGQHGGATGQTLPVGMAL